MKSREHHRPCEGGCGELADECTCPPDRQNPLGSMRIVTARMARIAEVASWLGASHDDANDANDAL